jgi:molybdate/tungstate transport system substrate-binding protein
MLDKDNRFIRPKETDLLALLESSAIDYIFIYRSVAEQHGLECMLLPGEVNLGNPRFSDLYSTVSIELSGKRPGEKITRYGAPMVYGVTIPYISPNPELAVEFLRFLIDPGGGLADMNECGQPPIVPCRTAEYDDIPETLKELTEPVM